MTDTLYRWVKATDALPPAGSEVKMKWDDGDKEWFGDPITELRDVRKQYYHKLLWQQPFTVPVDVEQAAEEYAADNQFAYPEGGCDYEALQAAFLAGASYSKEGFFLPILEENYNAAKQIVVGEDYDGKVFTQGEVDLLVETYEDLIEIYKSRSRPSFNPEEFLKALREGNPYKDEGLDLEGHRWRAWKECCNKAQELLNQKEG